MQDVVFIQLAKAPLPGMVKTRMLPELSAEQACELHCQLVLWTAGVLTRAGLGAVELSVAGSTGSPLFQQCRALGVAVVSRQSGRDLGERMHRALQKGLERYGKVILVGSDCPQIDRTYLEAAVAALDQSGMVLGPAQDGGYVLIGARTVEASWFEGVRWGTENVYQETVKRVQASGVSWQALPVLQDIDRPEDLPVWRAIVDSSLTPGQ